jgi:uncharacterized protein YlxP (DUF503 family)
VNSGVRRIVETMKRRFPLTVTSTTDHDTYTTSGNISDHTRGAAVDLGGAKEVMNRAAQYVISSGLVNRLKQAIYSGDPSLTYSGGQNVGAGFFGPAVMGQHTTHLHLAIAGALKGSFGALASMVGKLNVKGGGALGRIAQAVLNMARRSANTKLSSLTSSVDSHSGSVPSFHGPWVEVMGKIAQDKGWNLSDWRSLVSGESGGRTTARNPSSGAYGLGQFLGSTLTAYAKYGATSPRGEDQIRAMAQYISDRYGNPTNAYNTWLSRNPHWYAMGGQVPGGPGQPVPIVAHAGEWILNKIQQSKIAQMAGLSLDKLRGMLGFQGGPTSFQGGGEVFSTQRARAERKGVYMDPLVDASTLEGVANEINRVNRALAHMKTGGKLGQVITRTMRNITALTDEDGLLDQMTEQIQDFSDRIGTRLALAQVGLRRVGLRLVARRGGALADPVEIAGRVVENLDRVNDALRDQRRVAVQGANRVNDLLRRLTRGGIDKGERDEFRRLIAARNKFLDTLTELDDKIAENRQARYEAAVDRFNTRTDERLRKPERRQAVAEIRSRIASAFGREDVVQAQGVANLDALQDQQKVIQQRLAQARQRAKKDPRWREVVRDLEGKMDDIRGSIAEQIHANLAASVDAVNNDIDRRRGAVDIRRRISGALGRTGDQAGINQATINLAGEQIKRLSAVLPSLYARNDQGLIRQVQDQIADLQASIVETSAQMLQDAVDAVDRAASRRSAMIDIQGRFADLAERGGNRLGAIQQRQGVSAQRAANIRDQMGGLQGLLRVAYAQGNQGQIETLTDRLAELNVSLQEEIANSKDLIVAYRQAATELISQRTERSTGLVGTASGIIQKLGEIAGNLDNSKLLAMAQEVTRILQGAAGEIINNIGAAIGGGEFGASGSSILGTLRNAFAGGPESFANALAQLGPTIAALESTMGETQRTAFAALIQSMIDNTTATLDNTQQVNQLTGAVGQPQSWASTAWTWFRDAIFDGMGAVLPQYDLTSVTAGGYAATVSPYSQVGGVNGAGGGRVQTFNAPLVQVNEAEQGTVDETYLAGRLAFAMKNEGT